VNQPSKFVAWLVQRSSQTPGTSGYNEDRNDKPNKDMKFNTHIHKTVVAAFCLTAILQRVDITRAKTEKHSANNLSPARSNRA
jgi:hypothetical protein